MRPGDREQRLWTKTQIRNTSATLGRARVYLTPYTSIIRSTGINDTSQTSSSCLYTWDALASHPKAHEHAAAAAAAMAAAIRHIKNKQIRKEIEQKKREKAASDRRRHTIDHTIDRDSFAEIFEPRKSRVSWTPSYPSSEPSGAKSTITAAPSPVSTATGRAVLPPPSPSEAGSQPSRQPSGFWKYQPQVRTFYTNMNVQWFVAGLIILNFLVNVSEKEIDPSGLKYKTTWRNLEHTFNAIFLIELLVNMYSCWCRPFWQSSWNVFDFVVVCVGCVSFFMELKGPLKLMRTLRAFRVFRLFKRIESLNKIIVMIIAAVRSDRIG